MMSDPSLRILASVQGQFVKVFDAILAEWPKGIHTTTYVADSLLFDRARPKLTHLTGPQHALVKEWEIYDKVPDASDWERVKCFEREELGRSLFKAIVVDRRHIFGRDCKSKQDYSPRFSSDVLETRLVAMTADVLKQFDEGKPNACLSFGISNTQDYLIYRIAQVRGVPFFQVRSAKIENFIAVFRELEGLPNWQEIESTEEHLDAAHRFVNEIMEKQNLYEGSIKNKKISASGALKRAVAGLRSDLRKRCNAIYRADNQVEWLFMHNLRMDLLNKLTWARQAKQFFYYRPQASEKLSFLYPMHFEPEVAIQFFGPSYLNQIELIRTIAINLPVGAELLIREHPRSFGYRSDSYYRALAVIPRVKLLHPSVSMVEAIQRTNGVFSISGSTALEATIKGKPAWVFGRPYFADLDPRQVCHVTEMDRLDQTIVSHLAGYKHNRRVIEQFLAKIVAMSVRFNLYTEALCKSDRNRSDAGGSTINVLADYLLQTLQRAAR